MFTPLTEPPGDIYATSHLSCDNPRMVEGVAVPQEPKTSARQICPQCKRDLPAKAFQALRRDSNGYTYRARVCTPCVRLAHAAERIRQQEAQRRADAAKRYGRSSRASECAAKGLT